MPMRTARCKSCHAEIVWAKTKTDKSIPIDRLPVGHGNITVVDWINPNTPDPVPVVAVGQLELGDTPVSVWRYVSHFSTCPDAGTHRRRTS